jgi:4-hydroxy-tetrahydrodipicolinate synthase
MAVSQKEWKGCFCAIVTPFKKNGEIDYELFCKNIELLVKEGIDGIIVSGCTGESWTLSDEEKKALFELAVKQSKQQIVVIGGTGEITAHHTIKLSQYAKDAGMDGIMVLPPGMIRLNEREVFTFYQDLSNAIDIPILVYNIPKRQCVDIDPNLLSKLADIKNVYAVKESSDDYMRVLEDIRICGDRLKILTGHSAVRGVPSILMGAVGWVSSVETQIMGKEAIAMFELISKGKLEEAKSIQYRCIELDEGLRGGRTGTFPSFLKYAMNLVNRPGGYPRKPILPLTSEQEKYVESLLRRMNLL